MSDRRRFQIHLGDMLCACGMAGAKDGWSMASILVSITLYWCEFRPQDKISCAIIVEAERKVTNFVSAIFPAAIFPAGTERDSDLVAEERSCKFLYPLQ